MFELAILNVYENKKLNFFDFNHLWSYFAF
jgi:hypothetical protein